MAEIVEQLQRQLIDNGNLRAQLRAISTGGGRPPDGPEGPAIEALNQRVGRLEARVETSADLLHNVDVTVAVMNTKLDAIGARLADLSTRIDGLSSRQDETTRRIDTSVIAAINRVPSWWQMPAVIMATVTMLAALYAGLIHFHLLP
jgi:hypothetical protein